MPAWNGLAGSAKGGNRMFAGPVFLALMTVILVIEVKIVIKIIFKRLGDGPIRSQTGPPSVKSGLHVRTAQSPVVDAARHHWRPNILGEAAGSGLTDIWRNNQMFIQLR
jgi:hypothetical protein